MEKNNEELTSNISYEIVKEMAPDELVLFEGIKNQFLKSPDTFSEKDTKKREKMLGFEIPAGAEQFLTVYVLPVVLGAIKKYFHKKEEGELDRDKIKRLREDAYTNAILLGMDKEKAELMADSLIGKLVQLG